MKVKTSITLSEEILADIDASLHSFKNRSEFIETAVRTFIAQLRRAELDAKDAAILNRNAHRLNKEALDVLAYQVEI